MRKLSLALLLLALLCAAGAYQLRRWAGQTAAQQRQVLAQAEQTEDFFRQTPERWINTAAREALAQRPDPLAGEGLCEYLSPEEIRFVSMSKAWDEEKLRDLYEELLRNRHGEELQTLERVTVYAQEDEFAAATHQNTVQAVPFRLHFPLIPDAPICAFFVEGGQISLYGGDRKTTVAEMAGELSHEYGHHYTLSYVLPGGGSNMDFYRSYAQLRGLSSENAYVRAANTQEYYQRHARFLVEIAAEDYVVLMGSPNAMLQIGDYADLRDYANGREGDSYVMRNAAPQENMNLPFATQVPGLAELFYSFLDQTPPDYPQTGDVGLRLERSSVGYNLTTGYRSFVSYKLSWNKTLGEDAVYTLICIDPETEKTYPIRTVKPEEPAEAEIGELAFATGSSVNWFYDGLTQGTKRFAVVVTLPDGRVAVSEPVEKRFSDEG